MQPIRPVRRPLDGLSPYDLEGVQRWALQLATDAIIRTGRLAPRMVLVHDDHVAVVDLEGVEAGDPVQTVLDLADREDIEHRLLFGCYQEGDGWRAWVFGAQRDEKRSYWLAGTPFEVKPGGVGHGGGSWELLLGVGLEQVPFPVFTLSRGGPAMTLLPAAPPDDLELSCRTEDVPAGAEPPRDPVVATDVVSQLGFEKKAWDGELEGRMILIFRESTYDLWQVKGEIPFGLDDLVRNMCALGDEPLAAVVLSRDVFPHEGEHYRAVKMVSEAGGVRFERLTAMLWQEGDGDKPSHLQPFMAPPRPVDRDGWIGVAPITEVNLFPVGPEA